MDRRLVDGSRLLSGLVLRHQPDLVISAHIHEAPFRRHIGGRWLHRISSNLPVNAGQWPKRRCPCHLQIDGDTVTWRPQGAR